MQVNILEEHGFESAIKGMAYSFKDRSTDVEPWWKSARERASERALTLSQKDGGHNKFLESIQVWIDIEATRAFWSEFDTYRAGVTKQSESTMHTLSKRAPTVDDFEKGTPIEIIKTFIQLWEIYKLDVTTLKNCLPEGFLQRRIVCTNYKTLRNIIYQREGHRYKWWNVFIEEVMKQLEHPELIKGIK